MNLFQNIIEAEFLFRPNRFVVHCLIGGKEQAVYLPNPGRLHELLHPGRKVFLVPSKKLDSKYPYVLVAAEKDKVIINLHTHWANDLTEILLREKKVPGLKKAEIVRREFKQGHSRFDFLLRESGEEILLEVKSCTYYTHKAAQFPDAVTARGSRHLSELIHFADQGRRCMVVFLASNDRLDYFLPDYHTDPLFGETFLQAKTKVEILPLALKINPDFTLAQKPKKMEIAWDILQQQSGDRGAYMVLHYLPEKTEIQVGGLGKIEFAKGWYIYTGSARKNLSKRLERHQRKRKKFHWHIDYLRDKAEFVTALPIQTPDDIECDLAQRLSELADNKVKDFGCSDCNCASHLFVFDHNPLLNDRFHDFLFYFRTDRHFK